MTLADFSFLWKLTQPERRELATALVGLQNTASLAQQPTAQALRQPDCGPACSGQKNRLHLGLNLQTTPCRRGDKAGAISP